MSYLSWCHICHSVMIYYRVDGWNSWFSHWSINHQFCKRSCHWLYQAIHEFGHFHPFQNTKWQTHKVVFFHESSCRGNLVVSTLSTMLQKLTKCEVKGWFCWNLIILPTIRIYVKSNFGTSKQSNNVIFGNFRDSELGILGKFGAWKLLKFVNQNWEPLKWPKMLFLDCLNSPKFDFTKNRSDSNIIKF